MTRPPRPAGRAAQPQVPIPASLARHLASAVDLSSLRPPASTPPPPAPTTPVAPGDADVTDPTSAPAAPAGTGAASPYIRAVTTAGFEADVITTSMTVPVVVDFWADWCQPCKQLSPVLEALAVEYAGRFLLAEIDVDAEPQLGQAFQVQSIPTVYAVIAGQPVPLFQGALPAAEVRTVIDELLRVAAANGVIGVLSGGGEAPAAPPPDPAWAAADAAVASGDVESALAAYRDVLSRNPQDEFARMSVARCELLLRTREVNPEQAFAAAEAAPDDVAAQLLAADVETLLDRVDAAIERLVGLVRRTTGADREAARTHLVALFELLDPDDARLVAGRRALANALF